MDELKQYVVVKRGEVVARDIKLSVAKKIAYNTTESTNCKCEVFQRIGYYDIQHNPVIWHEEDKGKPKG